jgi:hypothetical protein
MTKWVCALLAAVIAAAAQAGEIAVEGSDIRVSGMIFDEDTRAFREALRAHPQVERVVFDRCLGGTLSAALDFATLVRTHRLVTVASRQTSSACALAFLAGRERRFDDRAPFTSIVFHAGRRRDGTGPSSDVVNRRILLFLETATNGRMSPRLLRLVEWSWSEASGVMFLRRDEGGRATHEVRYCDGEQGADTNRCRLMPEFDAVSQGIVTHL